MDVKGSRSRDRGAPDSQAYAGDLPEAAKKVSLPM
jgi:hypothetical protein